MMKAVTQLLLSITAAILVVGLYHFCFAQQVPQLVTVNVNRLVDEKIQQLAVSGKSEAENKEAIAEFGKKMEREIKFLAERNHLILLPSAAVLSGSEDMTDTLRKGLVLP